MPSSVMPCILLWKYQKSHVIKEFFDCKYEGEIYSRVIREDGIYDIDGKYDFNFIDNYFNGYIEIIKYSQWIDNLEEIIARIEINIEDLNDVFTERSKISSNLLKISYDIKELTTKMKEVKKWY